jgi:glycerol-3-phosphate dehydrogenase
MVNEHVRLIGGTKGSHLLIDHPPLRVALGPRGVYAEATDGRPVFVLPFGARLVLVGTTDIPFAGDPATARASPEEIEYLLAAVGGLFPTAAPSQAHVMQHYCGVRPLPARRPGGRSPAGITRRHMLVRMEGAPVPTWSIIGGKLTTCRSLAAQAAKEVLSALAIPVTASSRCRPLPGAPEAPSGEASGGRDAVALLVGEGVPEARATRLVAETFALFGARACGALGLNPDGKPTPEGQGAASEGPEPEANDGAKKPQRNQKQPDRQQQDGQQPDQSQPGQQGQESENFFVADVHGYIILLKHPE